MKFFMGSRLFFFSITLLVLTAVGCGPTTIKVTDKPTDDALVVDNNTAVVDVGTADTAATDPGLAKTDEGSPSDPGVSKDDTTLIEELPVQACPGSEGCSCVGNSDCTSGFCVPSGDGPVCTDTCVDECQEGWACSQLEQVGQDPVFVCLSRTTNLCRPCTTNLECRAQSADPLSRCVLYGPLKGSFCGIDCSNEQACPEGYDCQSFVDPLDNSAIQQCVPLSGNCSCNQKATVDVAFTTCLNGSCSGERRCTADGLTECDAQVASEEVCDNFDNNCDGNIDEDFLTGGFYVHPEHCGSCGNSCVDLFENGTGTCGIVSDLPGCVVQFCDDGFVKISSTECAPVAEGLCDPCSSVEDCVGDQQCISLGEGSFCVEACSLAADTCADGFTCSAVDDGAWCLLDSGGCTTVGSSCGAASECEDLNACTDDLCTGNSCVHASKVCDDANSCTVDSCDTATGCVFDVQADNSGCNDGDGCNQGETCLDGLCGGGSAVDCSDDFACTADICVEAGDDGFTCVNDLFGDTCLIDGQCYGAETPNPGNACLSCNPGASTGSWSQLADGSLCNDGNSCSLGDTCQSGVCIGALNTECAAGALEVEDCGLCGTQTRLCSDVCTWDAWSACEAQGPCSPGDVTPQACGNCGTRTAVCQSDCQWGDFGECIGQAGCTPGQVFTESDTTPCGLCGTQTRERSRTCSDTCSLPEWGLWVNVGACTGEGGCSPGAVDNEFQTDSCGNCGSQAQTRTRSCDSNCSWSAWSVWNDVGTCTGEGSCAPGQTLELGCGNCGTQVSICQSDCNWGGAGACVGTGECVAGTVHAETSQQSCGNCGVQQLERSRVCTGSCSYGSWGSWTPVGGCQGSQECAQGSSEVQSQEVPCEQCGSQTQERARTCGFGCNWGSWGGWINVGGCDSQGACEVGQNSSQTQFVDCGNCGEQQQQRSRTCSSMCNWGPYGFWSNVGSCQDEGVCTAGATEATGSGCGECEQRSRTCTSGCSWGSYGSCTSVGECATGDFDVDTTACTNGPNGFRIRSCISCNWGPWGICEYINIEF